MAGEAVKIGDRVTLIGDEIEMVVGHIYDDIAVCYWFDDDNKFTKEKIYVGALKKK